MTSFLNELELFQGTKTRNLDENQVTSTILERFHTTTAFTMPIRNVRWVFRAEIRRQSANIVRRSRINKIDRFRLRIEDLIDITMVYPEHSSIIPTIKTHERDFWLNSSSFERTSFEIVNGTTPIAVDLTFVSRSRCDYRMKCVD